MNQVAIGGHQFVVVAPHELPPREIGIGRLRHVSRQQVAQRVGGVALQVVRQPDGPVAAGGQFLALDVQEFVGGDIVGQVQSPVSHQHRRPDHGVERDIVLAYEVVALGFLLPKRRPGVLFATQLGPFLAGREVADDRFEPDVDSLLLKTGLRYGHSPFDVPGDGPILQPLLKIAQGEVKDVLPPVLLLFHPVEQRLLKGAQAEKEMLRSLGLGRASAQPATRILQLQRVGGLAALVALVAPGLLEIAEGAGAIDIAVRQVALALGAEGLRHAVAVYVALLQQVSGRCHGQPGRDWRCRW